MCSLHLESKCFKGRRVNWATAKPSQEPRPSTSTSSETAYDHSYSANSEVVIDAKKFVEIEEQNKQLVSEINKLASENKSLKSSNNYLKRKSDELQTSLKDFKDQVSKLKSEFDISHNVETILKKCSSEVPEQLFKATAKRAAGVTRDRQYHPVIRKFALTLQLASSKAYRLV